MILQKISIGNALLLASLMVTSSQAIAAVDCSKEGVAYYLKQGISADQVIKLCEGASGITTPAQGTTVAPQLAPEDNSNTEQKDDLLFFSSMVVADKVSLSEKEMVLVKKDCLKYGEEVEEDVPEYACGIFQTSLKFEGLEIEQVTKGIPLIRDAEFIVSGTINRKVLNMKKLDGRTQKVLGQLFIAQPETFDIPLRKDANPEKVAERLRRLAGN